MKYTLFLYFRLVSAQIRSTMQYRLSFIADMLGSGIITGLDFATIAILLNRFQAIGGWTLPEVAFLYGAASISLGLAELFVGTFDDFDKLVVRGEFDRVLLRPLGVTFQMLSGALALRRLGRIAQGSIALGYALINLHLAWDVWHWLFAGVMLAGGAVFFMAIFIMGATMAFWTPQTAELTNIFTYGGQFMTSYPMHIYEAWLRALFTFLIPAAFVNYYPALYLFGKPDPFGLPAWMPFLAPFTAAALFGVALALWSMGVKHYQSTGS
jgi:ABC-2 type transport system permease protein